MGLRMPLHYSSIRPYASRYQSIFSRDSKAGAKKSHTMTMKNKEQFLNVHERTTMSGLSYDEWCTISVKAKQRAEAMVAGELDSNSHTSTDEEGGLTADGTSWTVQPNLSDEEEMKEDYESIEHNEIVIIESAGSVEEDTTYYPLQKKRRVKSFVKELLSSSPSRGLSSSESHESNCITNAKMLQKNEPVFESKRSRQTFGGIAQVRKIKEQINCSSSNNSIHLTIPSSQYWAIVEGFATLNEDNEELDSFLHALLVEGRSNCLPTKGRLQELLPIEAGRWTAKRIATSSTSARSPRLGDWTGHIVMLRHQDHATLSCQKGYSKTIVQSKSISKNGTLVASLAIAAFDGFESNNDNQYHSPGVVASVLQAYREHESWQWEQVDTRKRRHASTRSSQPTFLKLPSFKSTHGVEGVGGIGILGQIVNHNVVDYHVSLWRQDDCEEIVGLDGTLFSYMSCSLDESPLTCLVEIK